jgi:hypothetical protein
VFSSADGEYGTLEMSHDAEASRTRESDIGRTRFTSACQAFEQVWRRGAGAEGRYVLAGRAARLRVLGAELTRQVEAPFAHLRTPESPGPPDLTIDLWDVDEIGHHGTAPATGGLPDRTWALDDGTLAVSSDMSLVSHATRTGVVFLDRVERRIVGWVSAAHQLPLYDRARPLQILLAVCAADGDVHAVHGAFVAREGRGVLLIGDSGAGKSTAALCCLEAGMTYLGDDWIGVGRSGDGAIMAHSLYSSVSLEPAQVACFPRLQSVAVPPRNGTDLKSLILLADVFPPLIGRTAAVCALALPRVVDTADTRIRPATKRDALMTMVRSAICSMRPRGGRAAMEVFMRLAQERPAFWLDVGRDLHQIPQRIDEILAATAS